VKTPKPAVVTTVATPKTPPSVQITAPTPNPPTPAVATPPTLKNNGLHLGTFSNGRLTDAQADSVAAALGGGLTGDDIRTMTLGEVLRAWHLAGKTTKELGCIFNPDRSGCP